MRYEIRKFTNGVRDYEAEFWPDTPLKDVREHALRVVDAGDVDRIEIRDGNGSLVMNVPRTLDAGTR